MAATAPIRPLAWEPPKAVGVALEKTKRQKKKSLSHHIIYITQNTVPIAMELFEREDRLLISSDHPESSSHLMAATDARYSVIYFFMLFCNPPSYPSKKMTKDPRTKRVIVR